MNSINSERLLSELKELAKIGATDDGGVSRVAFSTEDMQGREWYKAKIAEAGLDYHIDGAGNQSAILYSDPPSEKRILFGSHLDSVPNGGQYDGSLGTLVAFEALRTLKEQGYQTPITLEAVNFTSEENVVLLMMGSRAVSGLLREEDISRARMDPKDFNQSLSDLGITKESILNAKRSDVAAWVELHIEQGTRLEDSELDIGVVNAIVGIRNFQIIFRGEADHAGTKPMNQRKNALWGSSQFALQAKELVMEKYTPGVMNIGKIAAQPGASNIVPAEVTLEMEFRNGSIEELDNMQADLLELMESTAAACSLTAEYKAIPSVEPSPMDERVVSALENACDTCNLSYERMLSFAGHDTQSMANICPSAMYFVPSVDGVSHNPKEFTKDEDCVNGANVIFHTILELIEQFR